MAKKSKGKPKGKPKPRYKKAAAKSFSGAASRRSARSQTLPGMAQVRDAKLDEICESIGDGLDQINQGTEDVNDGKSAALARLHARGLQAYRHAGVRVTLVPGAEKVSVKREKDREVNVSVGAGEVNDGGAEGEGEGEETPASERGIGGQEATE